VPIREESRSGNCLSRLRSVEGDARGVSLRRQPLTACVKLRQADPIAFDSDPGPFRSSPPASPGDRRDAKRGGGRGVTFRLESEGMRWDLADAVTGRGRVPPVNPKERKYATPLFGGAPFGERRIRDAARPTTS
jgi:hypothetical protein